MLKKEKMIEVFGEESVTQLTESLKPKRSALGIKANPEVLYSCFLEWLLEEYKEPCIKKSLKELHKELIGKDSYDDISIDWDSKPDDINVMPVPAEEPFMNPPVEEHKRPEKWSDEAFAEWKKNKHSEPCEVTSKPMVTIENEEYGTTTDATVIDSKPKHRVTHDEEYYRKIVEDFYLSDEKTKEIRIKDDKSGKAPKSVTTFNRRFINAIKDAGLEDYVITHRYYQGTARECVALENLTVAKDSAVTYKYN